MVKKFKYLMGLWMVTTLLLTGCDDNTGLTNQCSVEYDQEALFESILTQQIQPGFESLVTNLNDLKTAFSAFHSAPSIDLLNDVKSSFTTSYVAWKAVEIFRFGPAEQLQAQSYFNYFPINTALVENQLNSGFDPDNSTLFDKGLPVLDYFIFKEESPEDQLLFLTKSEVQSYINDVLDKMISVASNTLSGFKGSYADEFTGATGTAAGTTLSVLVNALSQHFEDNRRNQLGIPSGALTLDIPNPDKTEAYYSSISMLLLKKGVQASQLLYDGEANKRGVKDYVTSLEEETNGDKVADDISKVFKTILSAAEQVDEPLSRSVTEDKDDVAALYRAMSDQVIQLKTDLPSRTCISITYVDNPSDTD